MTTTPVPPLLLGINVQTLWQWLVQPWRQAGQWRVFSWLLPDQAVTLLGQHQQTSVWLGAVALSATDRKRATRFQAVELPEDWVLRRTFSVPEVPLNQMSDVVALNVAGFNPFPDQDLVSGFAAQRSEQGIYLVEAVLASRQQVQTYLQTLGERIGEPERVEVWVLTRQNTPIVLEGFGEALREDRANAFRRANIALIGLAFMFVFAIALTPTVQLRLKAIDAAQAYQQLTAKTASSVREKEALLQSAEQLTALATVLKNRTDPQTVLAHVSHLLPDDSSLLNLKLQGNKLTLAGSSGNVNALMRIFGEAPGVSELRAPTAATRINGSAKETFVIEFLIAPRTFGQSPPQPDGDQAATAPSPKAQP